MIRTGLHRSPFIQKPLYLLLVLIQFCFTLPASAQKKEPIKVIYGIFIKKVVPDFKNSMFYAEFYWWANFTNDSVATQWSNSDVMNLEYINAHESSIEASSEEVLERREIGENRYYVTGYHQGNFYFNPDFTLYPFDKQQLNIQIENTLIPYDDLVIIPDTASYISGRMERHLWALSKDVISNKSVSYKISKTEISTGTGIYNSNFGDPDFPSVSEYSRINLSVIIDRAFTPFITKLIIPLGIILFLVYFVFFIPADKIDMAAALTVTSLLSAIAFQLSVNSDLPEIGYIIYVDKIFYTCYMLIALSMAESLWTFYLDYSGDEKKKRLAIRIDLISRFLFPLIFILSLFYFAN
jgi:hypothetical protein